MDFSCLLNCFRVSLLGFSCFCLILSMMLYSLSGVYILKGGGVDRVQFRL